jgi:hypothetical protein
MTATSDRIVIRLEADEERFSIRRAIKACL